jgi:hypothetical protein
MLQMRRRARGAAGRALVGAALLALLATPAVPAAAEETPPAAPATDPAAAPADPSAAPAAPAPLVMPTALGSWCTALFPAMKPKAQRNEARALLAGTVDMGNGGTYQLAERPNWKPQSGTDTSGDRHVHSLDWALPLLYQGVAAQNPVMVQRFRDLLYYWIDDHKSGRSYWIDASI